MRDDKITTTITEVEHIDHNTTIYKLYSWYRRTLNFAALVIRPCEVLGFVHISAVKRSSDQALLPSLPQAIFSVHCFSPANT
jgi:hypothetical protein